jgi:hypothetical protein
MDDDEWWDINAPVLDRLLDPGAFPVASRIGTAAATAYQGTVDPQHALDFGLERILDGVAALVAQRRPRANSSPEAVEKPPPAPTSRTSGQERTGG